MQRRQYLMGLSGAATIGLAGCTENGDGNGDLEVRVEYDAEWSGALSENGGSRSIQGTGTETIDVDDDSDIVSANAQKQDDSSNEITIQILVDGGCSRRRINDR